MKKIARNITWLVILGCLIIFSFTIRRPVKNDRVDINHTASSSHTADNGQAAVAESESENPGGSGAQAPLNRDAESKKFWDAASQKWGDRLEQFLDYDMLKENRTQLLLEGLSHVNRVVRWYTAYKASEYIQPSNTKQLKKALDRLLTDPDENVRKAAEFSLSLIKASYEGPKLVKSPDGSQYAFHKYHEAAYNDGRVWIVKDGVVSLLYKGVSIQKLSWSPDGKWLTVTHGGRTWTDVEIISVESRNPCGVSLFQHISQNAKELEYKIGANQRPDPFIEALEWSEDSSRVLLSYRFQDDQYQVQKGLVVYHAEDRNVEKIIKLKIQEGEQIVKPDDFQWDR